MGIKPAYQKNAKVHSPTSRYIIFKSIPSHRGKKSFQLLYRFHVLTIQYTNQLTPPKNATILGSSCCPSLQHSRECPRYLHIHLSSCRRSHVRYRIKESKQSILLFRWFSPSICRCLRQRNLAIGVAKFFFYWQRIPEALGTLLLCLMVSGSIDTIITARYGQKQSAWTHAIGAAVMGFTGWALLH